MELALSETTVLLTLFTLGFQMHLRRSDHMVRHITVHTCAYTVHASPVSPADHLCSDFVTATSNPQLDCQHARRPGKTTTTSCIRDIFSCNSLFRDASVPDHLIKWFKSLHHNQLQFYFLLST